MGESVFGGFVSEYYLATVRAGSTDIHLVQHSTQVKESRSCLRVVLPFGSTLFDLVVLADNKGQDGSYTAVRGLNTPCLGRRLGS